MPKVIPPFDYKNLTGKDPASTTLVKAFVQHKADVASIEGEGKIKRMSGVAYKELALAMADSQQVILRIKDTGDVFQVLVNNKVVPIKNQDNIAKAVIEIVDRLDSVRAAFQKAMLRKKVEAPVPKGIKTAALNMIPTLQERIPALKAEIEAVRTERMAIEAERAKAGENQNPIKSENAVVAPSVDENVPVAAVESNKPVNNEVTQSGVTYTEMTPDTRGAIKAFDDALESSGGDVFLAAKNTYQSIFAGHFVNTSIGRVLLTGGSWQEMKNGMKSDALRAKTIPFIPEILASGEYLGVEELHKPRKDGTLFFHPFKKRVAVGDVQVEAMVKVAERKDHQLAYYLKADHVMDSAQTQNPPDGGLGRDVLFRGSGVSSEPTTMPESTSTPLLTVDVNLAHTLDAVNSDDGLNIQILHVWDKDGNELDPETLEPINQIPVKDQDADLVGASGEEAGMVLNLLVEGEGLEDSPQEMPAILAMRHTKDFLRKFADDKAALKKQRKFTGEAESKFGIEKIAGYRGGMTVHVADRDDGNATVYMQAPSGGFHEAGIIPLKETAVYSQIVKGGGIDVQANEAATSPGNDTPEPTEAQKEKGNYKKGHINISGLDIAIENPAGSVRSGFGEDGKPWESRMVAHYGYVNGSMAGDGDHSDVFIKPGTSSDYSGSVFVIDQNNKDGGFDEHKAVIGVGSESEARELYLGNYDPGWNGLGAITEMTMDAYKEWVKDGVKDAPASKSKSTPAQEPDGQDATQQAEETQELPYTFTNATASALSLFRIAAGDKSNRNAFVAAKAIEDALKPVAVHWDATDELPDEWSEEALDAVGLFGDELGGYIKGSIKDSKGAEIASVTIRGDGDVMFVANSNHTESSEFNPEEMEVGRWIAHEGGDAGDIIDKIKVFAISSLDHVDYVEDYKQAHVIGGKLINSALQKVSVKRDARAEVIKLEAVMRRVNADIRVAFHAASDAGFRQDVKDIHFEDVLEIENYDMAVELADKMIEALKAAPEPIKKTRTRLSQ